MTRKGIEVLELAGPYKLKVNWRSYNDSNTAEQGDRWRIRLRVVVTRRVGFLFDKEEITKFKAQSDRMTKLPDALAMAYDDLIDTIDKVLSKNQNEQREGREVAEAMKKLDISELNDKLQEFQKLD